MGIAGVALLAIGSAGAHPVTGGRTVLKVNPAALENLREAGVQPGLTGAAAGSSSAVRFPLVGGDLHDGPLGSVEHAGGLTFESATGSLKLTDFEVRIGTRKGKLFARSEDGLVRFFDLELGRAIRPETENPFRLKRVEATLARPAAMLMSEVLGAEFRRGEPVHRPNIKLLVAVDQEEER